MGRVSLRAESIFEDAVHAIRDSSGIGGCDISLIWDFRSANQSVRLTIGELPRYRWNERLVWCSFQRLYHGEISPALG